MICICGPEWRNPNCDVHGNAQQECVAEPSGNPGQLPGADRATCEHCGRPIANAEDGEMHWQDPRCELLCWSNDKLARFCDKDPGRPGAPHRKDCPCGDCYVDQDRE